MSFDPDKNEELQALETQELLILIVLELRRLAAILQEATGCDIELSDVED